MIDFMNKVFVIGLPRTGTTSISVAMLDYGFKTAHTAYTKHAFESADLISDAPCFSDYKELDGLFPGSKFVYLDRELEAWVPSIQMLLQKMQFSLEPVTGVFSPVLKRSINQVFDLYVPSLNPPLTQHQQRKSNKPKQHRVLNEKAFDRDHLVSCYRRHQQGIKDYFSQREDFISINLSDPTSLSQLLTFLGIEHSQDKQFPHLNVGRHVADWREHKHPNKINANSAGLERRKFFEY